MRVLTNQTLAVLLAALLCMCAPGAVAQVPEPLPAPDGEPADQTQPVQVFILLGQSNMLGFGRVEDRATRGTLAHLVHEQGRYPHLVDSDGNWSTRRDVHYIQTTVGNRQQPLGVGCGVRNGFVGVELQFGHIMGHLHDAPVVILKACIGNRSLGWDLLPPGSERYEFDGRYYAGYGESPLSWEVGREPEPIEWYAGKQYDTDTSNAKAVLANLVEHYPDYAGQGFEVAGFVFWQGHKDQNAAHAGRYEQNLVRFIKTLREDFEAPDAKFVLATIGFNGDAMQGHALTIVDAQLAVDGGAGNYPEFAGNVATIDARPYWRGADESPANQGHHYNQNAETYMQVGDALGRAMARLLADPADD